VVINLKGGDFMEVLEPILQNLPLQWEWFWFGGTICIIVGILLFIIWILICVWVYRDAESRGMSGVLWLLIVLITSIVGLIIYVIIREDKKPRHLPPQQRGYPPPQQQYQYPPQQRTGNFCKNCGAGLEAGAKFCPGCGQRAQ